MKIFLVRHGSAESAFTDPQRPLSGEGILEVEALVKKFSLFKERPEQVFHSGILRAQQTADILCHNLQLPSAQLAEDLTPESNVQIWADLLEAEDKNTMLVGHMPFMGDLVASLTGVPFGFHTANLVILEKLESGRWKRTFNSEDY